MKILMDTHIFLWAVASPEKILERWRSELESQANQVYLSAITVAEISIKASLGKLSVDFDSVDIAQKSGFDFLDFTAEDALLLQKMPFHHRDPFDRMLISQGIQNRMTIMTVDTKFKLYDCHLMRR
jgi:PIN domain nuclease of toxin-antitoxin system